MRAVIGARERRRVAVAVVATIFAAPLLLVEVAPGADAAEDSTRAPVTTVAAVETTAVPAPTVPPAPAPRPGLVAPVLADTDDSRVLGTFSGGAELRAIAAAEAVAVAEQAAEAEREAAAERARQEAARVEAERAAAAERARQEEARRAAEAAAAAASSPSGDDSADGVAMPTTEQWAALRQCESGGNYSAISANWLYFGAYQFYPGTWNSLARSVGRDDLVGVRPDQAAPADQDALAFALFASRGSRPWPHCGHHLR